MNRGTAVVALQTGLIGVLLSTNSFAADLLEVWQAAKVYDREYRAAQSDQSAGDARRHLGDTLLTPRVNFVAGAGLVNENSKMSGAQFSAPNIGSFNNANFNTSINSGTRTRVAIQATQPLYDRELAAQKNQLHLSAEVSNMNMGAADQNLILRVTESYFEAVKAQARVDLLVEQQNAVSNTYSEISRRQQLGDASKIDLQETAEQVEAIKAKLLTAQLAYNESLYKLTQLTGQTSSISPLRDGGINSADMSIGSVDDWIGKAKANNPQLKVLALNEQVRSLEVDKYNSSLSPKVNLMAQVSRDRVNGSGDFGSASNTVSNGMIGVELSVPLTDGYRSSKKDEAFYLAEKAKLESEQASLEIERQIKSVWFATITGRDRVDSLTRMVNLSRDRLAATERSHRQGSRTTMELLGAQSDYISTKLVLLEEEVNLILSRVRLSSISGDVSEQDLVFANRFLSVDKEQSLPKALKVD